MNRKYPSKILLFGEYTVLLGSRALAIPYRKYNGEWKSTQSDLAIDKSLRAYLNKRAKHFLDLSKIETKKIVFNSTIPRRCGLGSSGAYSAAIYDLAKKKSKCEINILIKYLSIMESHFHGKSSGFDPLISYLDRPLIIDKKGIIYSHEVDLIVSENVFLLDSGKQRTNINLVPEFLDWSQKHPDISKKLVHATNDIIDCFEKSDYKNIKELFKQISRYQLQYLKPMILDELVDLWTLGLESDRYYLKICGSGDGGNYLIYSEDTKFSISGFNIESINSYSS